MGKKGRAGERQTDDKINEAVMMQWSVDDWHKMMSVFYARVCVLLRVRFA